jgi:hypothetical protein
MLVEKGRTMRPLFRCMDTPAEWMAVASSTRIHSGLVVIVVDETVNLRMSGDFAEQELRSLYDWLMRDLDALDYMNVRLQSKEPGPGEMGDTLDLIALVVTSGLQWPAFIETLSQWRRTRRHRPQVTIERGGTTVMVSEAESEFIVQIIKAMKDHE